MRSPSGTGGRGTNVASGRNAPLSCEHVHARVEVRQIPEGLHEQDQAGAAAGCRLGIRIDEQSRSDAAKLTEPRPVPPEDQAQESRQSEDVLPVRHRRENGLFDPLAVEQHALLVAARAEVARLARVGEQVVVCAGVTVDAGKAVMWIPALHEDKRLAIH